MDTYLVALGIVGLSVLVPAGMYLSRRVRAVNETLAESEKEAGCPQSESATDSSSSAEAFRARIDSVSTYDEGMAILDGSDELPGSPETVMLIFEFFDKLLGLAPSFEEAFALYGMLPPSDDSHFDQERDARFAAKALELATSFHEAEGVKKLTPSGSAQECAALERMIELADEDENEWLARNLKSELEHHGFITIVSDPVP